ncbi:hypothetical protein SKAU_G00346310 [Synaphobranchus kaupii]|uniref:Uncharacterized protein n=1 Tax=Synaphobranchus kaupii TaxID=118154 RepID=A0A9Q1EJK6_SYNKA|nr:hypothetical protein SKAU_G00346310 [Synaphobranchus kaupii]
MRVCGQRVHELKMAVLSVNGICSICTTPRLYGGRVRRVCDLRSERLPVRARVQAPGPSPVVLSGGRRLARAARGGHTPAAPLNGELGSRPQSLSASYRTLNPQPAPFRPRL